MNNNLVGINRIVSLTMSLSAVCLLTISCASNPTITAAQNANTANFQNLVHGKLVGKNGGQPIAGATVYIPKTADPQIARDEKKPLANLSLNSAVESTMGCPLPDEPYTSLACTDHFGNFTLSLINASLDDFEVKVQYEDTTIHTELALNDLDSDLGTIEFDFSQSDHKEKIAIVLDLQGQAAQMSNSFDGVISNTMKVEFEQEFSKMYDIDEDQYDVEFLPFPSLFEDKDDDKLLDIFNYKMIYLITPGNEDLSDLSKENKLTLLDYISKGGELFVTTLSVEIEDASLEEYI